MRVLNGRYLFSEEKRAEEDDFETDLIAGRLEEEVVRSFLCDKQVSLTRCIGYIKI